VNVPDREGDKEGPPGVAKPAASQGASGFAADTIVLFGATGDLARKKLFPALYGLARRGFHGPRVVGVARSNWDGDRLRRHVHDAIDSQPGAVDESVFDALSRSLSYISGDYRNQDTFQRLREHLGPDSHPLFYLAIPPSMFETVVMHLASSGLNQGGRVVVEKPFGRDLQSARDLNACLHQAFPEAEIYRIDHFLGKEPVQNLLVFRFANGLLDQVWNRGSVASVQLTMAEDFGVDGRGAFYDEVGAVRDVVQNHLLQVVAMLTMEPPVGVAADDIRGEKLKVFRAMKPIDPEHIVRGQYRGYRAEEGVAPDSTVETYIALRLEVESWRWAGIPFFIRAGKCLATTALEAVVEFNQSPRLLFAEPHQPPPPPNRVRFRLNGDEEGIRLTMQAKVPGEEMVTRPIDLGFTYDEVFGNERMEAYERLLSDALEGQPALFATQESAEQAWRIVTPVLEHPGPVYPYEPSSWGPAEADAVAAPCGGWVNPDDAPAPHRSPWEAARG
jgi:glucose-6-phosphate 1-dehydrogenase